jgi:cytochrome P450
MIQWLIDSAQEVDTNTDAFISRFLIINFLSSHSTSMVCLLFTRLQKMLTYILYDLAIHPEYIDPLREEIESLIASTDWQKITITKMWKLDSFLKESLRMHFDIGNILFRIYSSD